MNLVDCFEYCSDCFFSEILHYSSHFVALLEQLLIALMRCLAAVKQYIESAFTSALLQLLHFD